MRKSYGISPEPPQVSDVGKYTVTESAGRLGLSVRTVRYYITSGDLRAVNYNAERLRFTGRELKRFWKWKISQ